MRQLSSLFALGPSLLLWCLLPSVNADFYPQLGSSPSFQIPQYPPPKGYGKPVLSRWRDSLIRKVWGVPEQSCGKKGPGSRSRTSPPPSLLSRYGGDVVLRFEIRSAEEAAALADAVDVLFLDVWEFTTEWADIRLSKDVVSSIGRLFSLMEHIIDTKSQVPSLLGLLPASLRTAHTPLMYDLAQAIYDSYPSLTFKDPSAQSSNDHRTFSHSLRPSSASETNIFFENYQPLSVITPWMRLLQSLFPSHVRMINIGITYEGRDIPALRVGVHPTNNDKPSEPRKTIIVAGGSHAREWISTSTVTYIAYNFITSYGKSKATTDLLENFDWIFIPTLNPDGYVYTWESDRLWRKNRQQTSLRFCTGLDLDRAWGFEWDGSASRSNPCSESFSGEEPFQAVESRRLAQWAKNETEHNNVTFAAFLDLHSYSQQVLYPYSYSCTKPPPTLENLEECAIGLAKAIRITKGEIYGVTTACEGSIGASTSTTNPKKADTNNHNDDNDKRTLWPKLESSGGSALDWFYHEMRVPYAYQIKLRDTGSYGFLLPARNIVPTGKEVLAAVEYLGSFLMGNKGIEDRLEGEEDEQVAGFRKWRADVGVQRIVKGDEEDGEGVYEEEEEGDDVNWELKRKR